MSAVEDRLSELEKRILIIEQRLGQDQSALTRPEDAKEKALSIKEFLNSKSPSTANDRALLMGYFLEIVQGQEAFSADDIKSCFRAAKIPAPKNVNDVINKNISKAYIMDSGSQLGGVKRWVLTMSGEEFVEKGLGKDS